MNLCIFCGRLAADPDIRYSKGDTSVCIAKFTLAVERPFKKQGQSAADYIRCESFGKLAEGIEKYTSKGTKLIVVGELQNDNYEKDGVKHYAMKIVVSKWEFAESRKAAAEAEETVSVESIADEPPRRSKAAKDDFMPIPSNLDIDMPFA